MKTKIALLSMIAGLMCFCNRSMAQVDLVPCIDYYYTPPGANGIITFDSIWVCNNDAGSAGAFDVAIYLYNTNTHNVYIIGDTILSAGISGYVCTPIYMWSININNTAGIPAGTYQPGMWINSKNMITETDTTNNYGLFSGSWTYTPTGINELKALAGSINVYPNPCNGWFNIAREGSSDELNVELYNVLGEKVSTTKLATTGNTKIDLSTQAQGVYFYKVLALDGTLITSGKLVNR